MNTANSVPINLNFEGSYTFQPSTYLISLTRIPILYQWERIEYDESGERPRYLDCWWHNLDEACAGSVCKRKPVIGVVKPNATAITNARTWRTLHLAIVRPVFGYASQVWSPQSINLVRRMERLQRRASMFMLNLSFLCRESNCKRLITLELMLLRY